jgi:FG-GAP-like repeat
MQGRILAVLSLASTLFSLNVQAQFSQLKSYGAGAGFQKVLKADLNNDNKLDLVGAGHANGAFNVTALLGNGKGGFSAPVVSAISGVNVTGDPPQAVADFNNDGVPDYAFIGTDPTTGAPALGIMFGKGNGSFDAPKETILPGTQFFGELAAGDFTGSGKVDLVFANDSNIIVVPGKGNGKFGTPVVSSISQFVRCLAVGDFNNDGKLDLTVGTSVMLGNGNGTFQSPVTVTGGGCNVALADVNHDGNLDLITGTTGKTVHVYLGDGSGAFNHFKAYNTGNAGNRGFASFAVADFNGDGHPDIAVLNGANNDVTILLNQGTGSFKIGETFNGGNYDIVAGDFNGDNRQDLVISSGEVNVLIGKGNGTFTDALAQNNVGSPMQAIAADFNNDHKLDLLTFDFDGGVQLGNGNGTFKPRVLLPSSCRLNQTENDNLISVAVGDFNKDGNLDLAVIVANEEEIGVGVGICLGNGDGTFKDAVVYDQGIDHQSVVAGDFNHDGNLDLAVSDQGGVSILLGNGDGTFQSGIPTALNASFPVFTVGDFNNDGKLDVAAITGTTISVLLGKGNGKFQSPITSNNTNAVFVVAGDLNNDGNLDLVTVNSSVANTISVLLGNGKGAFAAPATYPDLGATQAVLGDFNGDGKLDVAFSQHTSVMDVLLGKGDGTFLSPTRLAISGGRGWVAPGDFNGDGALDLVDLTFGGGRNKLVVFLNSK